MMRIFMKLAGAFSLAAMAGCGGSDGPDIAMPEVPGGNGGQSAPSNAIGYAASVGADGDSWLSEDSEARFTQNDDGSVTVKITEGPYTGEERTFSPSDGNGNSNDPARTYMTTYAVDDVPVVAVIRAQDIPDGNSAYYAFRSTEGLTENMPTAGSAYYSGEHTSFGRLPGGDYGEVNNLFAANVNFSDGSLNGKIYTVGPIEVVNFDGAIEGAEFRSVPGSMSYSEYAYGSETPVNLNDKTLIDQNSSAVEGAFYGDAAKSMGGTFVVNGQGEKEGAHLIGGFIADSEGTPPNM